MSLNMQTNVLRADLVSIVQDIFQTMLSMEVAADDNSKEASDAPVVTACMHLSGPWKGAVLLQCQAPAACEFAAALIGIEKPATADDDVRDAMGELVNMVAGNFKSLLGGGAHLSLPTVVEGADYRFRIMGGQQTERMAFQTPAGVIHVSLVEIREPAK